MIQPRPTLSGRQSTNRRIITNAEFAPKDEESECHIRQSAWGPCMGKMSPYNVWLSRSDCFYAGETEGVMKQ